MKAAWKAALKAVLKALQTVDRKDDKWAALSAVPLAAWKGDLSAAL